ncbi:MAG: putative manganese transporter [Fidelibacterota bacterium]
MDKGSLMHILEHSIDHTIMISSFVFVMMLIIEYVNIQTRGLFHSKIQAGKWRQYLLAGVFGIIPGCLGSFTVVALYSHGILSFGALVTTMIATAGDEAFIMMGMIPGTILYLFPALLAIGIFAGWFIDKYFNFAPGNKEFILHEEEQECGCFKLSRIVANFKKLSIQRIILLILVFLVMGVIFVGTHDLQEWDWKRITFLVLNLASLFIVVTVPDHFLEDHLWGHIVKKHLPQIIGWTFGAIIVAHFMIDHLNIAPWLEANTFMVMVLACLVGLIPESGPHLVFVTFFAQGMVPFSVLLASSVVQDGHGMLPLLAESRKNFFSVKAINFVFGIVIGSLAILLESII